MEPLPGDDPSGINLQHSGFYTKIEEARREEDPELREKLEKGGRTKAKKSNFMQVVTLTCDGLKTKSKDLWLAVWLCDALIHEEHLSGLRQGLDLLVKLVDQYWESLYPKLAGTDPWPRSAPLDWLGEYCNAAKGSSPTLALRLLSVTGIVAASLNPLDPPNTQSEERKRLYRSMAQDLENSLASLAALDSFCQARFPEEPPSFVALGREVETISATVHSLLESELQTNPDAVAHPIPPESLPEPKPEISSQPPEVTVAAPLSEEIKSTADAIGHITTAARYLQRTAPSSPVPYLVIRALRWGELRDAKEERMPDLLESPSSDLRIKIRRQAQLGNWSAVLETAETAMCTGCGRGWLDLQRYAISACEHLGYDTTARALRSELKQLLSDIPQLATCTLLDDTGAVNPETASWLRKEGFTS